MTFEVRSIANLLAFEAKFAQYWPGNLLPPPPPDPEHPEILPDLPPDCRYTLVSETGRTWTEVELIKYERLSLDVVAGWLPGLPVPEQHWLRRARAYWRWASPRYNWS